MHEVICESTVDAVVVYARGARVTRRVRWTDPLPDGPCTLVVRGVTPMARGAIQATVVGERSVVAVTSALEVPVGGEVPGRLVEQLRDAERALEAVASELRELRTQRDALAKRSVTLETKPHHRSFDAATRFADSLATSALWDELIAASDARLREVERTHEAKQRERDAVALEVAQSESKDRAGTGHPTRTIRVAVSDGGALESAAVTYVVGAARWWPAYSARLRDQGTAGSLTVDAIVLQDTLEPWSQVELTLSTADLAQDIALPKLPSWRIGRARPAKASGFREPPEGLGALFAGYDAAIPSGSAKPKPPPEPLVEPVVEPDPVMTFAPAAELEELAMLDDGVSAGAPPALMMASAMPAPQAKKAKRRPVSRARRAAPPRPMSPSPAPAPPPPAGGPLSPADAWMDFDRLVLAPITSPSRGTLVQRSRRAVPSVVRERERKADRAPTPKGATDPRQSRGVFDHQYRASRRVDVASRHLPQRVTLMRGDMPLRQRARVVPVMSTDVFREVHARNPFESPLLAGPLDVYMGGSLVTTSALAAVDKGGNFVFGLGVEERVRVARNVHARENTAGLFGGGTEVEHQVEIELASALGVPIEVDVIERIPITDDDEVTVKLRSTEPTAEAYDQKERGEPVRGGYKWRLIVPAGGKASAELIYTIGFSAKLEIEGGNHRD